MLNRRPRKYGRFQGATLIAGAVLLLVLFVSAGFLIGLQPAVDEAGSSLTDADVRRLLAWREERPDSYRYVVDRVCECAAELDAAYYATESYGSESVELLAPLQTDDGRMIYLPASPIYLDGIVEIVEDAAAEGLLEAVRFDSVWNFPSYVRLSPAYDGATFSELEVRDFEALAPP